MSTHTEHLRLKPALDLVRKLDIGNNQAAEAVFDPGSAGFQIWCTPEIHPDDPEGWNLILDKLITGAFTKPCGFVDSVCWKWKDEQIVGLILETSAYALKDHLPDKFTSHSQSVNGRTSIQNRPEDIAWVTSKIKWLFAQSGSWPCPPIFTE